MFKDDLTRVKHMLDSANEAISFISDKTRKDLEQNKMLVLSLVKCIEIIGEAANSITDDLKSKHKSIPWQDIIKMRHRLIHTYFDVDYDIVWKTVNDELPVLIKELKIILSEN